MCKDVKRSIARTSVLQVSPANRLQMTIRYLAGGSYHYIWLIAGVSKCHFYHIVWIVIMAVNNHHKFELLVTTTEEEQQIVASGFQRILSKGIFTNVIGCVDGWLCLMQVPPKEDVGHTTSFFNGHYQRYGLKVQACCD